MESRREFTWWKVLNFGWDAVGRVKSTKAYCVFFDFISQFTKQWCDNLSGSTACSPWYCCTFFVRDYDCGMRWIRKYNSSSTPYCLSPTSSSNNNITSECCVWVSLCSSCSLSTFSLLFYTHSVVIKHLIEMGRNYEEEEMKKNAHRRKD